MKKWTIRDVEKLRYAGTVDRPRPFPGRFPTRVAWVVKNSDGRQWSYIGKPSINTTRAFLSKARQQGTFQVNFYEFDRGHLLLQMARFEPIARLRNTGSCNLATYYRPFWMHEPITGVEKFYSNKIAGHWIYSNYETVPVTQIEQHTAWLRGRY